MSSSRKGIDLTGRQPMTTRTVRGVVLTVGMVRALSEVVTNDYRYDLPTILTARTAAALHKRGLVRYTGLGEQVRPTSHGVWTIFEAVDAPMPDHVRDFYLDPDRDDAVREYRRREGITPAEAWARLGARVAWVAS